MLSYNDFPLFQKGCRTKQPIKFSSVQKVFIAKQWKQHAQKLSWEASFPE
jgi:hypothetical protein